MEKSNNLKLGDKYEITKDGSLGLMAFGYKGVMAWRKKVLEMDNSDDTLVGPLFKGKELAGFSTGSIKKIDEEK